jgi:hypothetical protein
LSLALSASADTIVLKSGRRIETWKVEERGDRVYYQTPDGEVGIPKRLVERIERDNAAPSWAAGGAGSARDLPQLEVPAAAAAGLENVIVDGKVDRARLAQLEDEANRIPTGEGKQRAAAAHARVGEFHLSRGELEAAAESYRRALRFEPNHPALLLNLAAVEVQQQRYPAALEHIALALRDPRYRFEAYRLQGWIYYHTEDMNRALAAWKSALAERHDPELEALLEKAEREERVAEDYLQHQSGRFVLRYDSGEARGRVHIQILAELDSMFSEMVSAFNYSPREPIVVLLYPDVTFYELTGMPPQVHGLYDGKIRVPVQGLSEMPPRLRTTLRHELVHAFVFYRTRGRAPRWLQEGLAQWHAGQRPSAPASAFRPLFEPRDGSALPRIEDGFDDMRSIGAAYMASWYVVDALQSRYGRGDMDRFLEALAGGESQAQALYSAFRLRYEDLDREVFDSLR